MITENNKVVAVAIICLSALAIVKMVVLGTNGVFCLFVASLIGLVCGVEIPKEVFYGYLKKIMGG